IVAGGLFAWIVSLVSPQLGGWLLSFGVAPFCTYLEWVVNSLGRLPFAAVEVTIFSAYWIPVLYLVSLSWWQFKRRLVP
ncbi:MAG: hypothetical protein ABL962_18740, partial [Fimbriimonadaceae bacterium]